MDESTVVKIEENKIFPQQNSQSSTSINKTDLEPFEFYHSIPKSVDIIKAKSCNLFYFFHTKPIYHNADKGDYFQKGESERNT